MITVLRLWLSTFSFALDNEPFRGFVVTIRWPKNVGKMRVRITADNGWAMLKCYYWNVNTTPAIYFCGIDMLFIIRLLGLASVYKYREQHTRTISSSPLCYLAFCHIVLSLLIATLAEMYPQTIFPSFERVLLIRYPKYIICKSSTISKTTDAFGVSADMKSRPICF